MPGTSTHTNTRSDAEHDYRVRTTAATKMNDTSSRSHAVFSLILTQRRHDVETGMDTEKVSKISLVDLAGSERANSTGAVGARLKEGAEINRSLSTLGRVIAALAEISTGKKKDAVVPFRDSILTWLLKDALGGNSRTAIIATISPADVNYEETMSTLRYADSAKRIKTHAVVNEDPNAKLIRELKEELANLRAKLSGNPDVEGTFDPSLPPDKQFVMIRKPDGTLVKVSKAEIAEQLAASEKLMNEMNQTWEEKLAQTQAIQKERESALEALGISVEKGMIGFHSPRVPHLVNLSDDPLLAECLVYNLKPGVTTTVGDAESDANIKLSGANILRNHCRFENTDNVVTLYPLDGALVMVNGLRLTEPKRLRSGFRVILGDFHFFRFNNPYEAKADRLRLRHSTQLSLSSPYMPGSPANGSDRGDISRTASPTPLSRIRAESPTPFIPFSVDRDDSEWSMARREAALAMIGPDSNVDMLNDDELDALMMSLQKHKHLRKARPESRLTEANDDDNESNVSSSNTQLGKHDSIATIESLDYDTNLSSWPSPPEPQAPFVQLKMDLEQQLEQQKSEYEEKLTAAKLANVEIAELRKEKEEMQETLAKAKAEAEKLLRAQAEEFETRVKGIAKATGYLTEHEKKVAAGVLEKWRSYRASKVADTLLQYAGLLKEAQVLSCSLGKKVVYQFGMIPHDPLPVSLYEMNLESGDEPDDLLVYETKPSIAVKILDFNTNRIYFWSLSKFKDRLRIMRGQRDNATPFIGADSPRADPFVDNQPPTFALVGMSDVPLYTCSQLRSQRFKLDVYSPHTFTIVAEMDVSLICEPAITGDGHTFDVHLHTVQGFNAFMGTDFHIQVDLAKANLSTEGREIFVSKKRSLSTGSTLKYDQRFTVDCPVPLEDIGSGASRTLRFEVFVKPTTVLLESLNSWDELRSQDEASKFELAFGGRTLTGIAARKLLLTEDERHDVTARIQVQEMTSSGKYESSECRRTNDLDPGVFVLHLGVQRRLRLKFSHSSGKQLQFKRVAEVKLGAIREVDSRGRPVTTTLSQKSSPMRLLSSKLRAAKAESVPVEALATFDPSVSETDLMDRKTPAGNRILVSLTAVLECERVKETIPFSMDLAFEVHSRNSGEPGWLAMFTPVKQINTATRGLFELVLTPAARRGRRNLWKRSSAQVYIRGEEVLGNWRARGVSLLQDHQTCEDKLASRVDLEIARCRARGPFESHEGSEEEFSTLLQYCVSLWKAPSREPKSFVLSLVDGVNRRSFRAWKRNRQLLKKTSLWNTTSSSFLGRNRPPLKYLIREVDL